MKAYDVLITQKQTISYRYKVEAANKKLAGERALAAHGFHELIPGIEQKGGSVGGAEPKISREIVEWEDE